MNIHSTRSTLARARMIRSARRSRGNRLYSKNSSASSSTNRTNLSSNSQTKQIAMYEQVEKYSNALNKNVENMLSIGAKTEVTENDKTEMISNIKKFVTNYNFVYGTLSDLSSASNQAYQNSIAKITSEYADELKEIGITVSKDNELSIDTKTLEEADFEKIKSIFGTEKGYADKIGEKFAVVEKSAASSLNVLDKLFGTSTYNSSGNYSNYTSSYYNNSYNGYNNYYGNSDSSGIYGGKYYNSYNNWG